MKSKLLVSAILASAVATSASAVNVELFGHLGAVYNQEFGDYTHLNKDGVNYGGFTGHLGIDIGSSGVGFGVGGWGGSQIWATNDYAKHNVYGDKYIDLSDLYFRYNGTFDFYVGRFSNSFMKSDWLNSYAQGVSFSYNLGKSNIWVSWINDHTTYGVLPGRIASELTAYHRFPSSFNSFDIGKRDIIAGGANLDFGIFQVDPFVHYFLDSYAQSNVLQAGTRAALVLGGSGVKSITSGKFMWQNGWNGNTFFVQLEEELRFQDMFKLGGGWYMVGDNAGIKTISDNTRFYGRYMMPSHTGYFGAGSSTWYAFGGVEHERVKLDVLYAGGDYSEFSAVASVRVFDLGLSFMREGLALDVGGGYVNNGFGGNLQYHNAIAFAKLVF